jgi:hypothetical protein
MSEATSVSKGPIVAKVLIDLSEYNILLKAKAFQEEHEKKLKLDYVVKHTQVAEQEKDNEDLEDRNTNLEKSRPAQVGQGSSNEELTTLIKKIIEEQFESKLLSKQSGSGANDLAPELPLAVEIDDHQPISAEVSYSKSDHSSGISKQLLLEKVSRKNVEKATKLLEAFDEDPNTITWDSNGVVYINGSSLAGSNMFVLMPELFKMSPNRKLPGFLELVSEIASLGLGNLISKKMLRGLQRSKPILNQKAIYEDLKKSDNWWFIG